MNSPESLMPEAANEASYQLYGITLWTNFPFVNSLAKGSKTHPDLRFSCSVVAPTASNWQSSSPIYKSQAKTESGESSFTIYRNFDPDSGDCPTLLHFTDTADYYIWPHRIYCHLFNPNYDYWVEIGFLGAVMSLWLELSGILALHASAVAMGGKAVGFLGSKQGGKTSLAATLAQAGYSLLTDDILAIEQQNSTFWGYPGYPQMRMWPDLAQHFLGDYGHFPLVHPGLNKYRIPVGADGIGQFCRSPWPLKTLYLPERRDPNLQGTNISIVSIPPQKALLELLIYAFAAPVLPAFSDIQPARLQLLAAIAQNVPVKHLTYPDGYEHLPKVRDAIIQDIEQGAILI